MNSDLAIQTLGRVGLTIARYALAISITGIIAPAILWTITYIVLFLAAIATNSGLGSPVAYPITLLFLIVYFTACSIILYLPSTALAELITAHCRWPTLVQIPISAALLALLCIGAILGFVVIGYSATFRELSLRFGLFLLVNLLPMGLFWWIAQSIPLAIGIIRRVRSIIAKSKPG
jgi:hypothetical protein